MRTLFDMERNELLLTGQELPQGILEGDGELEAVETVSRSYPMRVTRYYADLIEKGNRECPVRKQCIPNIRELDTWLGFEDDPLGEEAFSPVPFLIHKYRDRAAFLASTSCFMYCRHCTRKNTAITRPHVTDEEFDRILEYLRQTKEIRDVLITGGDPLTLSDEKLEYYLSEIRKISHIETVRIGTRAIVTYPRRITKELADMLGRYHPLWINTQFNHPAEITKEAAGACEILQTAGIPIGNQTVLMHGINDDIDTMERLVTGLIRIRVRPYYLYQLDRVKGTEHFYVPYEKGMEIVEELRRRVSGYAVPRFVIDAPGPDGGKIVVEKNHILNCMDGCLTLAGREAGTTAEYRFPREGEGR